MQDDSVVEAATSFKPASRVPLIVTGVASFVGGALLGALITGASMSGGARADAAKPPDPAPSASVSAPAASASASLGDAGVGDKPSLANRAASGDPKAVGELEKRPVAERTAAEAVALAKGREAAKVKELEELVRKIALVPKLMKEDKDTRERMKELTRDREVATELLKAIAAMPGEPSADLLYTVLTTVRDDETERLAEELLYSKDVRTKASRALSVLLDLRKIEKCEDAPKVLERAKLVGDRRSLVTLMRFHNKRGCGEKKLDDCWPCLRDGDLLKDATIAVQKRSGP